MWSVVRKCQSKALNIWFLQVSNWWHSRDTIMWAFVAAEVSMTMTLFWGVCWETKQAPLRVAEQSSNSVVGGWSCSVSYSPLRSCSLEALTWWRGWHLMRKWRVSSSSMWHRGHVGSTLNLEVLEYCARCVCSTIFPVRSLALVVVASTRCVFPWQACHMGWGLPCWMSSTHIHIREDLFLASYRSWSCQ